MQTTGTFTKTSLYRVFKSLTRERGECSKRLRRQRPVQTLEQPIAQAQGGLSRLLGDLESQYLKDGVYNFIGWARANEAFRKHLLSI